jgi:hypothetical protein
LRREVVHQRLDFLYVSGRKELSSESAPEKVLRFIQRSPRDLHKSTIVLIIMATGSFGNVRTNAVGAPHDLLANSVACKPVPTENDVPYFISEILGQFINPKILEIRPAHNLHATDYSLLTTDF